MGVFIRNPDDTFYFGDNWPGFSVWTDLLAPFAQEFWTYELTRWYQDIHYDGIWIDLSEASSFCSGSCGTGANNLAKNHLNRGREESLNR